MNPLTNVKNITKLNETELSAGTTNKKSWHDMYKGSAWIFIGGLPYDLTEGDVLSVFSQYGEIVNINLVRDKKTGKTKGFCFLCYANQKSTILAVDNFNAIKICGRIIRVDHVANYKPPKEDERDDELTKALKAEGCAPKPIKTEPTESPFEKIKKKKVKKEKKKKKDKKSDKREEVKVKIEKHDPGYDKYEHPDKYSEAKEYEHKNQKTDNLHSSNYHNSGKNNDKHHKTDSYLSKTENSASILKHFRHGKSPNDSSSSSDSSSESEKDYRNKRKAISTRDLGIESSSSSSRNVERNKKIDDNYRHKVSNHDYTDHKHDTSREYKGKAISTRDLGLQSSSSSRNVERNKETGDNYKHKLSNNDYTSHKHDTSREHNRKAISTRDLGIESSSSSSRNVERNKETDDNNRHKLSNNDYSGHKRDASREYRERHDENKHKSYKHNRQDNSSSSDEDRSSKRHEKRAKKYYHEESFSDDKSKSSFHEQKHKSHNSSRREEYYERKGHHK